MNSIEKVWREFLFNVLVDGEKHTKDDGDKLMEHLGNHCFIPNVLDSMSMNGENQHLINNEIFLKLIGQGVFNIKGYPLKDEALMGYVKQLDDASQIYLGKDSFIYTYPERIFNMYTVDKYTDENTNFNQFEVMVDRLVENKGSNRAVATLYNVGLDRVEQHIPCLNWLQFLIRGDELYLFVVFRSNDLYNAFPSNMLFLNYLGLKMEKRLSEFYPLLKFKGIDYSSSSLHIYESDLESASDVFKD